jgi:hypothetical protein
MRHLLGLLGITILLAVSASAQGPEGTGGGNELGSKTSRNSGSASSSGYDWGYSPWQFSLGYQYNQINLTGNSFSTNGLYSDLVRNINPWLGVEGQMGAGFGNTGTTTSPSNLNVKNLFLAGGPRITLRNHTRFEPWVHGIAGWEHFKFTQTSGVLGSNSGFGGAAGGGMDYHLGERTSIRASADEIWTRFFSTTQRHFQIAGGFVYNF